MFMWSEEISLWSKASVQGKGVRDLFLNIHRILPLIRGKRIVLVSNHSDDMVALLYVSSGLPTFCAFSEVRERLQAALG
jgi:hypothetical protein